MLILDSFQQKAIGYIESGCSVLVCAPTGAGKTVIAERVIEECIEAKTRVIYTAPIKALSNQKFRDFSAKYPEYVGIITGDVSLNPHAPILIMTTEIFRNKLLDTFEEMKEYSWVIFDEIHYIDDPQRGSVWEEAIMFLPPHMKLLCLSATIPNIREFAGWIEKVHEIPLQIVEEKVRPVPLHFFYQCQNNIYHSLEALKPMLKKDWHPIYGKGDIQKRMDKVDVFPNKLKTLIKYIWNKDELPCIYFSFSRTRCEQLARELNEYCFISEEESQKIKELYFALLDKYGIHHQHFSTEIVSLLERGIAYHHAGMLPSMKEIVERLFTSRLIKVIFTTETFALGINMPAKTVIFDELRKFYGFRHENIKTRDFYQMAGRAGRRGIDEYGLVFSRLNPRFITLEDVKMIVQGKQEPVLSQFNSAYATILHLYERYGEKLGDIYPKTLHFYQANSHRRKEALDLLMRKVELLKCMKYIDNNRLTMKGEFASGIYGYELPMGELFSQGYLEPLDERELLVLVCGLVFEPRKHAEEPVLSKKIKKIKNTFVEVSSQIYRIEKTFKIRPFSKKPAFHIAPAIEAYADGMHLGEVLRYVLEDEGEIVRYFRMVIQVLREIQHSSFSTPALAQKAAQCVRLINRDEVDAERQLKIM